MSIYYTSLNSGSNGNCYYIGNETEAILVDVGLSCREVEKRLLRLELDIKKIKAIFISHEHGDHIRGVEVLSRKHKIPVYITPATCERGRVVIEVDLIKSFKAYQEIKIGGLHITAFPKLHDAADPHSFIISNNKITVGVFTDIGMVCEHVKSNFEKCHAVFLEANYDEDLLENGTYPYYLKERIRSDKGHLSNNQASTLFANHQAEFMSHILLSHLSKENNEPDLAIDFFSPQTHSIKIEVASRLVETPVYFISSSKMKNLNSEKVEVEKLGQKTLFERDV